MHLDINTAVTVPVNACGLVDDTDGKTLETAVAYNASGMTLAWHFLTCAGVYSVTAVTPTNTGNHLWTNQGNAKYTVQIPASAGTINNSVAGVGWFEGVATGVRAWSGPKITFRAAGTNDALIDSAYSTSQGLAGSNLDAAVSSRSTYAGGDTSGVTTLLSRLTSGRAGNLDAAVSTRSVYAGGDTAGTTTLLARLTNQRATNLDSLDATVSSRLAASGYTAAPDASTIAAAVLTKRVEDVIAGLGDSDDHTLAFVIELFTEAARIAGAIRVRKPDGTTWKDKTITENGEQPPMSSIT